MSGDGTSEEVEPQLTCLLIEAPFGQQEPPHGEADLAYDVINNCNVYVSC